MCPLVLGNGLARDIETFHSDGSLCAVLLWTTNTLLYLTPPQRIL